MTYLKLPAAAGLAIALITGSPRSSLQAQEAKGLLEKLSGVIAQQEERVATLEKSLKEKDREIADLRKKVEEIAAKPKADVPAPKPKGQGLLGVAHEEPTEEDRTSQKLKAGQGAKVTAVHADSPAARAGIEEGDIILSVAGKDATSAGFRDLARGLNPGEKVEVVLSRKGEKVNRSVEVMDREKFLASTESAPAKKPSEAPKAAQPPAPPKPEPVVLGVIIEEDKGALTVKNVEPKKTGAAAQLKEEDVILSVNGKVVKKLEDLTEARDRAKVGEELTIEYKRKDEVLRAVVVAAGEKGEPKLVKVEKVAAPQVAASPSEAPKAAAAAKSPAQLGVEVTEEDEGVLVLKVKPGGSAHAAGIKENDILNELAGQKIKTIADLKGAMKDRSAGDVIALAITRGGERKKIDGVKLLGAGAEVAAKPPEAKPDSGAKPEAKPEPKPAPPAPPAKPRGVLGITALEELEPPRLIVSTVNPKGPAEKAGLKKDDLILKVNGQEVKSFDDLERVLKNVFAGDTIKLMLKRGEEMKEVELVLGSPENPASEPQADAQPAYPAGGTAPRGVYVGVALLEESGLEEIAGPPRITIEEVHRGSPAARAGLRAGDELVSIDRRAVRSLDEVSGALKARAVGDTVLFRVARSGNSIDASLVLEGTAP